MTVVAHTPKKMVTRVSKADPVTVEEMAGRVVKTREEHGDLLQQFHKVWYEAPHTWHYTHFLGVGMMKCPTDIWMYQQMLTELRPVAVVETGTYKGASAAWFAFTMDMLQINEGIVITVDIDDYRECGHPRITFLGGDSTDPALVESIIEVLPEDGPRLVVLDSDHSAEHVYQELCLYAPLVRVGDWLVVEDTNISWPGEEGARGGLQRYVLEHQGEFVQDVLSERYLLTMNPGGWLQRVALHASE